MATSREQPVELSISEPWELASSRRSSTWVGGTVVGADRDDERVVTALAVRLQTPLKYRDERYPMVIASARGEVATFVDGYVMAPTECNFIGVPSGEAIEKDGVQQLLSQWRGGLAGIATLRPSETGRH